MGLIISVIKSIINAFGAVMPIWLNWNRLPLNHPNNVSAPSMRSQIDSRLAEQMYYFELGVGLLNMSNARAWAREMSRDQSALQALIQVVNLVCYTFDCPYAEIWRNDTTQFNTLILIDYFVRNTGFTDNYSLDSERAMRDMGFTTKSRGSIALIWEVAGVAVVTEMPVWARRHEILSFFDTDRKGLVAAAGFKSCFAVPVANGGVVTHCLCFFRKDNRKRDMDLMRLVKGMVDEIVSGPSPVDGNNPNADDSADGNVSDISVVSATSAP